MGRAIRAGVAVACDFPNVIVGARFPMQVGPLGSRRLKDKVRCFREVPAEKVVRHLPRIAGEARPGVAHSDRRSPEDGDHRKDEGARQQEAAAEPPHQKQSNGNGEHEPLVRPAIGEQNHAEGKGCRILPPAPLDEPGQGAQQQRPSDGGHRAAVIRVHPIAGDAQPHGDEQASEQRPSRAHPALQHPAARGAHESDAEPDAHPGVPRQGQSNGHDGALCRRVDAGIDRSHENVHAVEVGPTRMDGVDDAAVREGVGQQKVAELVVKAGRRHGHPRQQDCADDQRRDSDQRDRQVLPARQSHGRIILAPSPVFGPRPPARRRRSPRRSPPSARTPRR